MIETTSWSGAQSITKPFYIYKFSINKSISESIMQGFLYTVIVKELDLLASSIANIFL